MPPTNAGADETTPRIFLPAREQEENVQLFNEITASKAKAVQNAAELKVLREKLAASQTAQQTAPPTSAVSCVSLLLIVCLSPCW